MEILQEIKNHLASEVTLFEEEFRLSLTADNVLLQSAVEHFMTKGGKRIRPLLVLLAARASTPNVTKCTIDAAVSMELLHSASLIHDDVVDETLERRGSLSMNALFNNKVSILVGDYFLSASLVKSVETQNMDILTTISSLSQSLTVGEIQQLSASRDHKFSEEVYFSVIGKKTASLFSSCLRIGALSVDASMEEVNILAQFGHLLGLCFQIKDDIFDYFSADKIGKPSGNDIRERKVTLPLLYALSVADVGMRGRVESFIKSESLTSETVEFLLDFAKESGGIAYAESKMDELSAEAIACLHQLAPSRERDLLESCLSFVIRRDY